LVFEALQREQLKKSLISTIVIGCLALLLFLPWGIHQYGSQILAIFTQNISTSAQAVSTFISDYNAIGSIFNYLPAPLWILLAFSAGWLLWQQSKPAAVFSLWWFLALLAANPQWLNLPGSGILSSFTVFIAVYIPAGVLIGAAFGNEVNKLEAWLGSNISRFPQPSSLFKPAASAFLILLIMLPGILGARQRVDEIRISQYAMVARPDMRAAAWIRDNLPEGSRFLVNSFFAYGNSVVVGSDGGWWLPLLAQRPTTLPPLNYGLENDPWIGYRQWINSLVAEIQDKGLRHSDVMASLNDRKVTHIYIGQQQGRVNYSGPYVFDPEYLLASPQYRLVYHQDRVWIFEVKP
jgi:hypothetical protein